MLSSAIMLLGLIDMASGMIYKTMQWVLQQTSIFVQDTQKWENSETIQPIRMADMD
jgi:hypothetical protein